MADVDYPSASIPLTISAGTTSGTVMIIASDDDRVENEETFTLSLTSTDPALMPQSSTSTVSINDTTSEYIHSHMVMSMTYMKEMLTCMANVISRIPLFSRLLYPCHNRQMVSVW